MVKRPSQKGRGVDTGRVTRPKAVVLSESSLVPPHRLLEPPPNQFTHEIQRTQPYYLDEASDAPHGQLAAGTQVVLMRHDGGASCHVVDSRGLYVTTAFAGLRRLRLATRP
jgi:hypothetical protein